MKPTSRRLVSLLVLSAALILHSPSWAQKKYDTGATDTEIKIGQTMPYSGPASAYGTIGRVETAYFKKLNEEGGINGRKIKLLSLDDAYSPPRTVEMVRRLVEQDEVLFVFGSIGTATNSAVHKYLNAKKVPQLFISTGATKWGDPKNYPWTMGFLVNYRTEGRSYARDILANHANPRIAVLFQNDDYGKDLLQGLKEGLGDRAAKLIVAEASYEITDPTVDSQIVSLKGSGAEIFVNITTPKFAAMAIRKVSDLGWRPVHYLNTVGASVGAALEPAGLDKSIGLITIAYLKDATDAQWADDPAMKDFIAFMTKYLPDAKVSDKSNITGYSAAQTLVQVLKQCGDDLTRANVMRQAANLKELQLPLALPGIKINTSPTDYDPIKSLKLQRFNGKQWVLYGDVIE